MTFFLVFKQYFSVKGSFYFVCFFYKDWWLILVLKRNGNWVSFLTKCPYIHSFLFIYLYGIEHILIEIYKNKYYFVVVENSRVHYFHFCYKYKHFFFIFYFFGGIVRAYVYIKRIHVRLYDSDSERRVTNSHMFK